MPGIVRLLLVTAVFAALLYFANSYLYKRLAKDLTPNEQLRRAVRWFLIVVTAASLVVRPLGMFFPNLGGRPLQIALLLWWGVALYVVLTLIPFELARAVRAFRARKTPPPTDTSRRDLLATVAAGSALFVGAGAAAFGARRAFARPEVTEVALRLKRLPKALDGLRIVQLTDIHVGALIQERFLETLVEVANAQKPDLVAITGDLVDGSVDAMGRYVRTLQKLSSRYGTFFVTGNHDYYSGADAWCAALDGLGFTVLRNRRVTVGDEGASIDLYGVDDPMGSVTGRNSAAFEEAFKDHDPERACVLLAHRPNDFTYSAMRNVDVQLSGHTHGGQLFPGTLVSDAIWGPWSKGLSRTAESYLYVSRGCGFVGPPLRVGSPPEVVQLTLVAG